MTTRSTQTRLLALVAVPALFLIFPVTASAHAELLETIPADGATVEGIPDELAAGFDESLLDESSLSIRNAAGERLAVGRVDPDDATRVVISEVPELAPGTYEMRWTAATADGHVERGTWFFTVAAAPTPAPTPEPTASAATPSAVPTASGTPDATAAPSPSATPAATPAPTDQSAAGSDVILPIIAALALVAIGAGFLLSRRGRPSDGV